MKGRKEREGWKRKGVNRKRVVGKGTMRRGREGRDGREGREGGKEVNGCNEWDGKGVKGRDGDG